jgi:hypothetical protein
MVDGDWNEAGLLEVKGLEGCNASNHRSEGNLARARDLTPIHIVARKPQRGVSFFAIPSAF